MLVSSKFEEAAKYKTEENELMNEINHLELELYKTAKRKVELIDIAKVINMKTKIPVYELLNNKLEITPTVNKLNKEIKGQEHAIKELVDVYKKIKLGFNDENKCYMYFILWTIRGRENSFG